MLLVSASGSLLVRKRTIHDCRAGEALEMMAPYARRSGSLEYMLEEIIAPSSATI